MGGEHGPQPFTAVTTRFSDLRAARLVGVVGVWAQAGKEPPELRAAVIQSGLRQLVRSQDLEIHIKSNAQLLGMQRQHLQVTPSRIAAVGRTSYQMQMQVLQMDGTPVATVRTVMVLTDSSMRKTVPVPDVLRSPVAKVSALPRPPQAPPRPPETYVWRTTARYTEADHYGHLNQTSYMFLAEEARSVAAAAGGYNSAAAVSAARCLPRPPLATPPPPRRRHPDCIL
eukprot:TRINITY_DN3696_c0_g1_i4.p1 TRINITY_DN3696_c0_g1~~TRINITY_DN3696_c0_g1_i4.p1  ORF type:complete len:251 (+),score=80.58 TRINITY_DN3696_c0_g1_i4:75-755(+)